jgi:hypothetical protein
MAPFIALPAVGSLAELVLADGPTQPVRTIEVFGFRLTVAASVLAAGVAMPGRDDVLTLRWAGRRGRCAAPVRVCAAEPEQRSWTIEPVGTVEVEQRRRFARAAGCGPVHLGPAEPNLGVVLVGELIDIGEGGLRCRLAAGGLDPDQPVFLRLLLDDQLVTLRGVVHRLDAGPGGLEVVVTFQPHAAQAGVIRSYVRQRPPAEGSAPPARSGPQALLEGRVVSRGRRLRGAG